jgi:hypothetical protein
VFWKKFSFLIFLLTSPNAFSYNFTTDFNQGIYWKTFPIVMKKFVVQASDGALLTQIVAESEAEWENVVKNKLGKKIDLWNFTSPAQTGGFSGNYIRWSENFAAETGYSATTTLAVTIRYNAGSFLERVEIILNGNRSDLKQNWNQTLKKTILHEFGHSIGLDHTDANAVMAAYLGPYASLQSDDIEGGAKVVAETLYRQETGYTANIGSNEKYENNLLGACGTVDIVKNQGPGGGGFLSSILLGFALIIFLKISISLVYERVTRLYIFSKA